MYEVFTTPRGRDDDRYTVDVLEYRPNPSGYTIHELTAYIAEARQNQTDSLTRASMHRAGVMTSCINEAFAEADASETDDTFDPYGD
jgi:hypothetical protein